MPDIPLNLTTVVIALIVLVIAVGLFRSVSKLVDGFASRNWPTVHGVIVSSRLVQAGEEGWEPKIEYRFTVNGEEHVSTRRSFAGPFVSWRSSAEQLVKRYRSGVPVTVHYDPEKPSESVLEPGVAPSLWFALAFEIVFLAIALWIARDFYGK